MKRFSRGDILRHQQTGIIGYFLNLWHDGRRPYYPSSENPKQISVLRKNAKNWIMDVWFLHDVQKIRNSSSVMPKVNDVIFSIEHSTVCLIDDIVTRLVPYTEFHEDGTISYECDEIAFHHVTELGSKKHYWISEREQMIILESPNIIIHSKKSKTRSNLLKDILLRSKK